MSSDSTSNQNRTFGGDGPYDYVKAASSFAASCPMYPDLMSLELCNLIDRLREIGKAVMTMAAEEGGAK